MSYEQRSFHIEGNRNCVRLEPEFWRLAKERQVSMARFVKVVDQQRARWQSLRSALRREILRFF